MSNDRYDLEGKGAATERGRARLLYISTAKYGGDWHCILHTHACTELFYVVGGAGQFKIEELLLPVAVDDMVIINPNVEHTEMSLNESPLEYIVLGVEGMELGADEEGDGRYTIVNFRNSRADVLLYLRSMLRELGDREEGYEVVCQDLLEVLLVRLMRRTDIPLAQAVSRRASRECAAVKRYIDSHFKENISLDLLSELAHVNKYYMVHAFSREYGVSPINYLISRRIRESRCLLSDTDHSLSQISHMLGFSSPSYFSQSFRRLEGMSPMEFRRQRRSGNVVG